MATANSVQKSRAGGSRPDRSANSGPRTKKKYRAAQTTPCSVKRSCIAIPPSTERLGVADGRGMDRSLRRPLRMLGPQTRDANLNAGLVEVADPIQLCAANMRFESLDLYRVERLEHGIWNLTLAMRRLARQGKQ